MEDEHDRAAVQAYQDLKESIDIESARPGWDSGPVLRVYKKRLLAVREKIVAMIDGLKNRKREDAIVDKVQVSHEGCSLVYIALFQLDGCDMVRWEVTIKSLARCISGRPVYRSEADVRKYISNRSKVDQDAYVSMWVSDQILNNQNMCLIGKDIFGCEVLTLPAEAIVHANIVEFVHSNQYHYQLVNNRLSLKSTDRKL